LFSFVFLLILIDKLFALFLQEMEKVGPSRHYNLVYFNAFAELSAIPDNIFFQQLHAALHPSHKRNMKVGFPMPPSY
jgi:hypothetical protein